MDVFNLLDADLAAEDDRSEGWHMRSASVTDVIGGARIGGSVYDLDEGQWTFPYHYHHGVEEWLVVVTGEPTLRTPAGERSLAPGDTVCFPSGSGRGARRSRSRTDPDARCTSRAVGGRLPGQ